MDIINGIDGQYVISEGKLLKIVSVVCSRNWLSTTSGWIEYTLEDGTVLRSGNKEEVKLA